MSESAQNAHLSTFGSFCRIVLEKIKTKSQNFLTKKNQLHFNAFFGAISTVILDFCSTFVLLAK